MPVIILDVEYANLQQHTPSDINLKVTNKGFGVAAHLTIKAQSSNEQFAGGITCTQLIARIAPEEERVLPLSVSPLQYGPDVPLHLTVSYADGQERLHEEEQTILVLVDQTPEPVGESQILTNVLGHLADEKSQRKEVYERKEYRLFFNCRESLSVSELREICFAMDIEHENFPQTKSDFVLELIRYVSRRDRMDDFRQWCGRINPSVDW
ncbi:MAG: hypothetical protein IPM39_11765 [Chloroflexi bacterium]|nr:hypothetical protein [Chloroflexota bacterium]